MLKEKLIPTPLFSAAEVAPIECVPPEKPGRFGKLGSLMGIWRFGAGLQWGKMRGKTTPAERAVKTREFLEQKGGLYVKAGQLMSLRTDVFGPEMVDELSKLTYQCKGFPPETARQVVEGELGRPLETVFSYWEEAPFAAASLAQLHRARLRTTGDLVAVKVQRPGVEQLLERDLSVISSLIGSMGRVPSLKFISWDGMIRELKQMMLEESDYRYEAANLRRMRKGLKDHNVYVPRPYRKLCSRRVVVMEFVNGVVMSDYLKVNREDPARLEAWCAENNIEPAKVGSRLMRSFYRQLFEDNLFHGDLHPGNIMLLRDSRFALLDFGTIGSLEERFVRTYRNVIRSFSEGDYTKAMEYYVTLADSIPPFDLAAYRTESVEVLRQWEARSHLDGLTFYERSFTGGAASELSNLARKYQINPSWQFLRVGRSLNTMDANAGVLLNGDNPGKIVKRYFRQAQKRSLSNLREDGVKKIARAAAEGAESATMLSDMLRRQSIVFQGTQSRISYIIGTILNVIKVAIIAVGLFLLYDFLHHHANGLVSWFHNRDGLIGGMVEQTPGLPRVYALLALVGVVLLFVLVSRLAKRAMAPAVRLPNGRLDNA